MGKPVVGARAGQVAKFVVHGATGLLYEPGDAGDLAERMHEVRALPDRGAALGAAARRGVVARHTWEGNARRIAALAESLCAGRAGAREGAPS